jgi:DNA-binding transcriptional regulator PaaX
MWLFLTKHALVLSFLANHPRATGPELCKAIGVTERTVRKIITDLELEGYVTKKREGRRLRFRINPDLPLRGETHQEIAIGHFLEALGWKKRRTRTQMPKVKGIG